MMAISLNDVEFVGSGLARPECVLTTRSGDLFVSDKRGGVSIVRGNGETIFIEGRNRPEGFLPNGIALLPDRSFLIADLGPGAGVWHMGEDGTLTPRLMEVEGRPLPPTNFVGIDREDRTWVTVSTWQIPREPAFKKGFADGFIIMMPKGGDAQIVAEGIGFTNEAIVDPTGRWLYVNETVAQRTSRFPIRADGSLGTKEVVAQYGPATFPDGLTFDAEGGVWIVSVASNRVIRTAADGRQDLVLEDADPRDLERVAAAFDSDRFGRAEIDSGRHRQLKNLSSIAFGDGDLRTVYLGSLFGDRIARFRSPIKGAEPVHWTF
jgi:SMP-30/Gluconolactonase/LRE-like region